MINIYLGDSLEAMKGMGDDQYDLAIVDPPYGLNIDGQKEQLNNKNKKHNRKLHIKKDWDNSIPDLVYFEQLKVVTKNQIIFGANYFVKYLDPKKAWCFWYKMQEGLTMSDGEFIYTSFDSVARIIKRNRVDLLFQNTIHPTEKPIYVYKWLLKNYGFNKDGSKRTIFDSHAGSMSLVLACIEMGFDIDCWEIDKDYYAAAKKRIENHVSQLNAFREVPEINFIK